MDGRAELEIEPSSGNVFSTYFKIWGLGAFQFLQKLEKITLV